MEKKVCVRFSGYFLSTFRLKGKKTAYQFESMNEADESNTITATTTTTKSQQIERVGVRDKKDEKLEKSREKNFEFI